jgi:AAA ATPase domain
MVATIRDVYLQFNPLRSLETDDPRYVDCMQERGLPALFQYLRLPLEDQPRPFLFSGHIGDGKTTILKQLQGQLEREEHDLVAFGQADDRLDMSDVEYDDVLLAILSIVDQSLRQRFQADMEANPLQRFWQEISRMANLPVQLDKAELSLGPFGKLTTIIRDSPDARLQVRQRLREARGATFLGVVNDYLRQAQDIVRQHGHRQLVVILDNLDRLPEMQTAGQALPDERLFIGQATPFSGCSATCSTRHAWRSCGPRRLT